MFRPSYVGPYQRGELEARAERAAALAAPCCLCPQRCRADRTSAKPGICGSPLEARVSSAFAHFGEEAVLVGCRGHLFLRLFAALQFLPELGDQPRAGQRTEPGQRGARRADAGAAALRLP